MCLICLVEHRHVTYSAGRFGARPTTRPIGFELPTPVSSIDDNGANVLTDPKDCDSVITLRQRRTPQHKNHNKSLPNYQLTEDFPCPTVAPRFRPIAITGWTARLIANLKQFQ
jgi:hypothetical protein